MQKLHERHRPTTTSSLGGGAVSGLTLNKIHIRALQIISILLFLTFIFYLCYGLAPFFHSFTFTQTDINKAITLPRDFSVRWKELQYVCKGIDPIDITRRNTPPDPNIGKRPDWPAYPPSSYFSSLLIITPLPFQIAKIYFYGLNLAGLVFLGFYAYRKSNQLIADRVVSVFVMLLSLTSMSVAAQLRAGSYSLIYTPLLVLMIVCLEKKYFVKAGLLLAISMIKPQIGIWFLLFVFLRGYWLTFFVSVSYYIITTVLIAYQLNRSIWKLLSNTVGRVSNSGSFNIGLCNWFDVILPMRIAIPVSVAVGFFIMSLLLIYCKKTPLDILICIPAVFAIVFSYSRLHDQVIIYFIIIQYTNLFFNNPSKKRFIFLFLLSIVHVFAISYGGKFGIAFFTLSPFPPHIDKYLLHIIVDMTRYIMVLCLIDLLQFSRMAMKKDFCCYRGMGS
jgi:hypothetical protein